MSKCRSTYFEGDKILEDYHDYEWCKVHHNDQYHFEMLVLESSSVGLSWKLIMHKREEYKKAFHNFDISICARMRDEELDDILLKYNVVKNRGKIYSVRNNARVIIAIQKEFGSFDNYLWGFVDGKQIKGEWKSVAEVPTISDISIALSHDMKKRGIKFMGPTITYSFMQSVGLVNDHLADCEYK